MIQVGVPIRHTHSQHTNMELNNNPMPQTAEENIEMHSTSRRRFLQLAGGIAGIGLVAASCRRTPPSDTYIGEGDVALLNYLYILKQVTVAFYTQAVATPYFQISASEITLQIDLRDQELAHREFFKKLLGNNAIKDIVTDLSPVTFIERKNFLTNACLLEDLTVAAYTGVARLITNTDYKLTIAKMASVDARHAGYMHDLLAHNDFTIDATGLDKVVAPAAGLATLQKYIQTKFDSTKLPTF